MNRKGFTLIELLVVIAILAVLAVAVTLILNPAELVRQGRDSTRLSDIGTVHRAIGLYFADQQEITFTASTTCTVASTTCPTSAAACTSTGAAYSVNASTTVSGTGWVHIDFTSMTTGSPLARLPIDPVNSDPNFYVFVTNTSEEYEIDANMESTRYANGGGDDVESTDGGDNDNWYEVGNDSELNL